MANKEESLEGLLQRNVTLSEALNLKDQELVEANQKSEMIKQRYYIQESKMQEYRQKINYLQNKLLRLIVSGAKRKIPKKIHIPSPVLKGNKGKVEGIVYPDEHGLVDISFDPLANNVDPKSEIFIVLESTDWKPERLTLEERGDKPIYTCKFKLEPGYKYNFRFIVNGSPVTDVTLPQLPNPAEQSYNYVLVGRSEELMPLELTKQPSYTNSSAERKIEKAKYLNVGAGEKEEPMMEDLKKLEGRLLHKFTFPEGMFRLVKWNFTNFEASVIRLCDNYKVPLDLREYRLEYITLEEIQTQYYSMPSSEEEIIERTLYYNRIHIKYKVVTDPYEEDTYCEPISIEPTNINIQEVIVLVNSSIM